MNFIKPKNAHNSLENRVRVVLIPFLDFQYFWTFWTEIPFSKKKKIKICRKKSYQCSVNLIKKVKKAAISLEWVWFCIIYKMDWWWLSMLYFTSFQQISSREKCDLEVTLKKKIRQQVMVNMIFCYITPYLFTKKCIFA